jgi:hypothetical protein
MQNAGLDPNIIWIGNVPTGFQIMYLFSMFGFCTVPYHNQRKNATAARDSDHVGFLAFNEIRGYRVGMSRVVQ